MSLALGTYDLGQEVRTTRRAFLWIVSDRVPQVLVDLHDSAFQLLLKVTESFRWNLVGNVETPEDKLRNDIITDSLRIKDVRQLKIIVDKGSLDEQTKELISSVFDWAERWNLNADWVIQMAFTSVNGWLRYPPSGVHPHWALIAYGGNSPACVPDPPEGFPHWEVTSDDEKMYLAQLRMLANERIEEDPVLSKSEASIRKAFVESIVRVGRSYCRQVRKCYDSLNYRPIKDRKQLYKHLIWSVQYQVEGKTFKAIADASKPRINYRGERKALTPKAVEKAVRETLKLIGLKEREGAKRGRPREKSKQEIPHQKRRQN